MERELSRKFVSLRALRQPNAAPAYWERELMSPSKLISNQVSYQPIRVHIICAESTSPFPASCPPKFNSSDIINLDWANASSYCIFNSLSGCNLKQANFSILRTHLKLNSGSYPVQLLERLMSLEELSGLTECWSFLYPTWTPTLAQLWLALFNPMLPKPTDTFFLSAEDSPR